MSNQSTGNHAGPSGLVDLYHLCSTPIVHMFSSAPAYHSYSRHELGSPPGVKGFLVNSRVSFAWYNEKTRIVSIAISSTDGSRAWVARSNPGEAVMLRQRSINNGSPVATDIEFVPPVKYSGTRWYDINFDRLDASGISSSSVAAINSAIGPCPICKCQVLFGEEVNCHGCNAGLGVGFSYLYSRNNQHARAIANSLKMAECHICGEQMKMAGCSAYCYSCSLDSLNFFVGDVVFSAPRPPAIPPGSRVAIAAVLNSSGPTVEVLGFGNVLVPEPDFPLVAVLPQSCRIPPCGATKTFALAAARNPNIYSETYSVHVRVLTEVGAKIIREKVVRVGSGNICNGFNAPALSGVPSGMPVVFVQSPLLAETARFYLSKKIETSPVNSPVVAPEVMDRYALSLSQNAEQISKVYEEVLPHLILVESEIQNNAMKIPGRTHNTPPDDRMPSSELFAELCGVLQIPVAAHPAPSSFTP